MLKKLLLAVCLVATGSLLLVDIADARRLGGGRSMGMQRQTTPDAPRQAATPTSPQAPTAAPKPATPTQPAAAPSGWRKWAAPLAGLAAGIGLAALLSHLGIGAEFAGILLAILAVIVVFALIRRFAARNAPTPAYAGAEGAPARFDNRADNVSPLQGGGASAAPVETGIPAGFDAAAFAHQAKVQFVRLQAANDAGDLDDIREFTSPEMFAEIQLDIESRGGAAQKTDVVLLNATVLEVAEEGRRYVASVRFNGQLREEQGSAPQAFDEIWHLSKPVDGSRGWVLAGIQQVA